MKNKNCELIGVFIILFFVLFLSSCSENSVSGLKKVKLNEVTRSVFYAPQYVAINLGYFNEVGIDIELTSAEGSDKTMTAVLSSQADIGLLGSSSIISVHSSGKEDGPVIFGGLTQRDGSFLIGRTPEFDWQNLKGKEIIAGRKGGVPEMMLEYILLKNRLNPHTDVKLLNNIQFNLMSMAFSRGIGDYVALFEPTASDLAREKKFYILRSLGSECDKVTYTCYCCSQKFLKSNSEVIERFTDALYKAQSWIMSHSAEETAKVIAPYFVDSDVNLIANCVKNYLEADVWCRNPTISAESFDLMQKIMISAGELEHKVDFNKAVTNQYALNSVKKMSG